MTPTFNQPEVHEKKWGAESWLINEDFCGKILTFDKAGNKCSVHFHLKKRELFYFLNKFSFVYIDTETAQQHVKNMNPGDTVFIPQGVPHQLIALEDNAKVIEFSSHHDETDSYRVSPGDSQKI